LRVPQFWHARAATPWSTIAPWQGLSSFSE
jgi:hypothetical protein